MLLVWRSDRNWQLTKSSLHEVDMWNMWESISCSEENACTTVHCTQYKVHCTIVHSVVQHVYLCSLYWLPHSFTHEQGGNWLGSRLGFQFLVSKSFFLQYRRTEIQTSWQSHIWRRAAHCLKSVFGGHPNVHVLFTQFNFHCNLVTPPWPEVLFYVTQHLVTFLENPTLPIGKKG